LPVIDLTQLCAEQETDRNLNKDQEKIAEEEAKEERTKMLGEQRRMLELKFDRSVTTDVRVIPDGSKLEGSFVSSSSTQTCMSLFL
jgi:hypothetical protein